MVLLEISHSFTEMILILFFQLKLSFHLYGTVLEPDLIKYRVAHEKPAHRLVDQRGRRSRTLYRKLNKCKCKALTGYRRC